VFGKDSSDKYIFEDGVRANYSDIKVRAKMLQIAFELKPIVENLDFFAEDQSLTIELQ